MKKIDDNRGFSLIELSIVLIIMGLLVAGITGGAALIKSAQLRTIMTEFQNYRVAFNTYYGLYDKVPGTVSPGDANKVVHSNYAWTDLKNEGIIEKSCDEEGFLPSKYKNSYWKIDGSNSYFGVTDFQGLNILTFSGKKYSENLTRYAVAGVLGAKETKSLLEKLDDGAPGTGLVRACEFADGDTTNCAAVTSLSTSSTNTKLYGLVSKLDF